MLRYAHNPLKTIITTCYLFSANMWKLTNMVFTWALNAGFFGYSVHVENVLFFEEM